MQADDLLLHVPPDQRVERAERLVEQQDLRVDGEGAGEADALALAAGELARAALLHALQADLGDDLGGPGAPLRAAHALDLQAVGHVVEDGAVRQQPEVLEDHRGPVAAQFAQPGLVHGADVLAVDGDGPAVGSISRVRQRTSVDLPEPDRPMTTKTSPLRTSKETSRTAAVQPVRERSSAASRAASSGSAGTRSALGPKTFHRPSTEKTGAPSAVVAPAAAVPAVGASVTVPITHHRRSARRRAPRP